MKLKPILLMALLACAAGIHAQTPNKIDISALTGYNYPGTASEPGTVEDNDNTKNLKIGTEIYGACDQCYSYDPMTGNTNEEDNDPFVYTYDFSAATPSGTVILNSAILTCTQCDYRGVPVEYTDGNTSQFPFDFTGQPLGQLLTGGGSDYSIQYLIEIPSPGLTLTSGTANYCSGNSIVLSTTINWPNLSGIQYSYEFQLPGSGTWQVLDATANTTFSFSPLSYPALANFLNAQTTSTTVQFRVRGLTAAFSGAYSAIMGIQFAPGPPSVGSINTLDACPGGGGSILLNGITGMGSYRFVLRMGTGNSGGCDPSVQPSNCSLVDTQGIITGSSYTISNVPAGGYTLLIANNGGSSGACYQSVDIQVNSIASLTAGSGTQTNISCPAGSDGSLTLQVSGGRSGTIQYELMKGGITQATQNTPTFSGLPAGAYTIRATDGCGQQVQRTFTLTQPTQVTGSYTKTESLCAAQGNGSLQVTAAQGSGTYNYYLYQNGSLAASLLNTTNTTWNADNLPGGTYDLQVYDAATTGCSGYSATISLAPPPPDISIGLTSTDVRCFGEGNGNIIASTGGGTGILSLNWQQQVSGSWMAMGNTASALNDLSPGLYRLTVTDANACSKTSDVVVINEPAVLTIPSVDLTDIVCYGGSGTITPVATGGNGGNTFAYSNDGGNSFTSFTPGAPFPAGIYQLKVTDSKGCTTSFATSQVISAPPSPVSFTDALSDYNGYNISCYGALTGMVTISATGGNGAAYSGYQYSIDGGTGQPSPILNGLPAGTHIIQVIDGRGCAVTRTETLTQPAGQLSMSLLTEKDNDCADGQAGLLTLSVTGGTSPYVYSRDNGISFQGSETFTGLPSDNYTVTVKDVNGCQLSGVYMIRSLYPPLTTSHIIQEAQCNGGSDGSITLQVNGGFGAYTYQWNAAGVTGAEATGLKAGTYIARITDDKGCGIGDTATVSQPPPLTATLTVRPLCSDVTGGNIKVAAGGGTPPYLYASDNGGAYQQDSAFFNINAGQHTVWVTDSHGCAWNKPVAITVNPLVPSVGFLVSTQQNALDTLQVEDISSPKPDSVQWTFDPAAHLLGSGSQGPLIQFSQPGTYPASIRAFYSGCDFSVTQNILIQPYDTNAYDPMVIAGLSFDTVSLTPNPNAGSFHLYVKLYKTQRLLMTIVNLAGQPVFRKQWDGQQEISEQVTLPGSIVSGAYMAELVTESDIRDYTILVAK